MTPLERLELERWMPASWAVELSREEALRAARRERPRKPKELKKRPRQPSAKQLAAEADIQETLKQARLAAGLLPRRAE